MFNVQGGSGKKKKKKRTKFAFHDILRRMSNSQLKSHIITKYQKSLDHATLYRCLLYEIHSYIPSMEAN